MRLTQRAAIAQAPDEPRSAVGVTPGEPTPGAVDQISVVIADDSAAIRTLARYALSPRRGFGVITEAADGAAALTLIDTHRPDCVVLDIEMPGMGGFETLTELRRRSFDAPVILLSGHGDAGVAERATGGGAAAYVDKSQISQLSDTIHRVVARHRVVAPQEVAAPERDVLRHEVEGSEETVAQVETPENAGAFVTHPSREVDALTAELRRLEYVVSHDLGEPLRIMTGFSTLLESRYGDALDSAGASFVTHIGEASRRMQHMLDDLLTYSRAGQLQPRQEDVDLDSVVDALSRELSERYADRHAHVTARKLPSVVGDCDQLLVVLRHLVVNAITFNTSTSPTVEIEGRVEGRVAVVTVSDNGIGFEAAQKDRAFELFQRFNTREEYPGSGTGLALCRRLMTLQHGAIELQDAPGNGSIVTLTMPASPDLSQQATSTNRRFG